MLIVTGGNPWTLALRYNPDYIMQNKSISNQPSPMLGFTGKVNQCCSQDPDP